ncbi:peptide-methionine (S)-S-oxide reductase MsrA [soil metagenome]
MENTEIATLAGGCFWGMEELIRKMPGVVDTEVGYTGGTALNATYRSHAGHAEAIQIKFDPAKISYEEILDFFFRIHDPTTEDRQGNDRGDSYRSAIFYHDEKQHASALKLVHLVNESKAWPSKVVTQLVPAQHFWVAENEHQDYLERIPNGYTCHFIRKLPSFLKK